MNPPKAQQDSWQNRVHKATVKLAIWTLAWLITLAIATFGHKFLWPDNDLLSLVAIIVNLLVGIGLIIANKNHLAQQDELQQKITLNAMAITLGVAFVVGLSYSLLDITNLIDFDAEISHLVTIMGLTYGISVFIGSRKYA